MIFRCAQFFLYPAGGGNVAGWGRCGGTAENPDFIFCAGTGAKTFR